jgi:LCP family protein required for cell wall assembly
MRANKAIWIWIAIVALMGVALIVVACETGALDPDGSQPDQTVAVQATAVPGAEPDQTSQSAANAGTGDKPRSLTVGKQYSARLVEEGSRNLLIIGEDKTSDMYDTLGIASIDQKNKTLKIIMIPRDTYIEYNQEILGVLEAKHLASAAGIYKINCTHSVGRMADYKGRFDSGPISFLADVVGEKFGVKIDDYVKINTRGFREFIDYLGGVDINVPYSMNYEDPTQDLYIHIAKGMQHLDGFNAEGFVRFRQGYQQDGTERQIGDDGRKKNQLYFLKELIRQKGTVKNIGKIPGLMDILGKNVQHSIGVGDLLQTYMGLARYIIQDDYEITTENLVSEKLIRINGSSYMVLE